MAGSMIWAGAGIVAQGRESRQAKRRCRFTHRMVHSGHLEPEYVAMEITLPSDLQKFVEEKVREGQFASADQVIVGALAVLREQEELRDEDVAELRGEV